MQAPAAIGYGFGLTIVAAGAVMLPSGLAMLLLSPLSGVLLNRWGGRPMLTAGAVVMAGAFVRRVFADGRVPLVVLGATLVGIGTALAFAAMPTLIMAAVPDTETDSANGLNSLVRSLGTSVCSALVALAGSVMSVRLDGVDFLTSSAVRLCFWVPPDAPLNPQLADVGIAVARTEAVGGRRSLRRRVPS